MPVFILPGPSASRGLGPRGNLQAPYSINRLLGRTDIPKLKDQSIIMERRHRHHPSLDGDPGQCPAHPAPRTPGSSWSSTRALLSPSPLPPAPCEESPSPFVSVCKGRLPAESHQLILEALELGHQRQEQLCHMGIRGAAGGAQRWGVGGGSPRVISSRQDAEKGGITLA